MLNHIVTLPLGAAPHKLSRSVHPLLMLPLSAPSACVLSSHLEGAAVYTLPCVNNPMAAAGLHGHAAAKAAAVTHELARTAVGDLHAGSIMVRAGWQGGAGGVNGGVS